MSTILSNWGRAKFKFYLVSFERKKNINRGEKSFFTSKGQKAVQEAGILLNLLHLAAPQTKPAWQVSTAPKQLGTALRAMEKQLLPTKLGLLPNDAPLARGVFKTQKEPTNNNALKLNGDRPLKAGSVG